jgi:hypothetical protein
MRHKVFPQKGSVESLFEISPFGNTPCLILIYVHEYMVRDTRWQDEVLNKEYVIEAHKRHVLFRV